MKEPKIAHPLKEFISIFVVVFCIINFVALVAWAIIDKFNQPKEPTVKIINHFLINPCTGDTTALSRQQFEAILEKQTR